MIKLYHKCIENGVAFVPGKFFFTDEKEGIETMRLNYTMADEQTIEKAIQTMTALAKKETGLQDLAKMNQLEQNFLQSKQLHNFHFQLQLL